MKPLAGLRILTIEQFGAAPYGSMFLADLGAELGDDAQAQRVTTEIAGFSGFLRDHLLPRATAKDAPADLPHWLADDFLRAVAMLLMAWAWARIGTAPGAESASKPEMP